MVPTDFALTAGWGGTGKGDAVMPGPGRVVERPLTPEKHTTLAQSHAKIFSDCTTTLDICLNERAYWRNLPLPVWTYKLGGYQVLKKWLSCRALGRPLREEEVLYFTQVARQIAGILALQGEGVAK